MPGNPAGHYRDPACACDRELFERWRNEDDLTARDALVERYMGVATRLAQRYRRAHEPPDDLIQVASVGLLKALERYDTERETGFAAFAVPTILGELKRHFRDRGWAVRLPRDLQEMALRVERTSEELSRRLGRSPTVAEVASEIGTGIEQVIEAQEAASAASSVPLDAPSREEGASASDALGSVDPGFEVAEHRATLSRLLSRLSERDREIVRLRFVEDLTQSEIGARVGISQMQVSRIIRRALEVMRAGSAEAGEADEAGEV